MRHATVLALNEIYEWIPNSLGNRASAWQKRACDWNELDTSPMEAFINTDAENLRRGSAVTLPDCPACAALLDLAMEMRGDL